MINNNKDNITNNNTYLILFIVFLIGFIVFLIGFIYYYCRNNANNRRFHLSKNKNFDLLNYKNGYKLIRNKKIKLIIIWIIYVVLMILIQIHLK